jgi:rubrerythrin
MRRNCMKSVKGTGTEKNLLAAFAGESQARNRYTLFAEKAEEEGYMQIARLFRETADNEKVHAQRYFSFLEGGDVEITATYPAGIVGSTLDNLKAGAAGENLEHTSLYPQMGETAQKEGFPEIAALYRNIAAVEAFHEKRYNKLISNVEKGIVFKRDGKVFWKCINCGRVVETTEPPKKCPTCLYPQSWFQIYDEAY